MKKIISVLLAMVIVVGCLPFSTVTASTRSNDATKRYSVLVLDVSGTAVFTSDGEKIYTADSAIEYVKNSAVTFLGDLVKASGDNYVAVVTYDSYAHLISDFTNDIDSVTKKVKSLSSNGNLRDIESGLMEANSLLEDIEEQNAIKNVILVTTGMTNDGSYSYTGRYDEDTVGSSWYRTNTGVYLYAYANKAYEEATIVKENATLYTLGLFQTMEGMPEKGKEIAEFFKVTAADLATSPNHFYEVKDTEVLDFVFGEIIENINAQKGYFKYAGQINQERDSVAEYWYTDSYFNKKASVYNDSLATMSLCLELSSWSSYDQKNWYNPKFDEKSDNRFWQDKLVNAKTLLLGSPKGEDGYEGIGFGDFAANDFWKNKPTKDSIGVCAARKQITDSNGEEYTLIALAVRGGGYGSEWASNFTIGEKGEHSGFALAKTNVISFLKNYVSGLRENESQKLKLWIVGYSRAGATANMVAGELNSYKAISGASISPDNIYCYTFEAPQGAVRNDIKGVYTNIHNVVNLNDLVPLVAPYSWGFAKYNYQKDIPLPSKYTESNKIFNLQLSEMKEELDKLGYGKFDYKIDEISSRDNIKIDKSKILPFGDPFIWFEKSSVDTHTVLEDGVNFLADDVIKSRQVYYNDLEYCIRQIMGMLNDYSGAKDGIKDYAKEVLSLKAFKNNLSKLFTKESITYIVSPMFNLNPFYSYEKRVKDVEARLMKKIGSVFKEYAEIKGFIESIGKILKDTVIKIAKDAWNNNTDSINIACKFADAILSSDFQAHFPEICLAWCRSLDANYNKDLINNSNSSITRLVRINCPVDIDVYDDEGVLVASIVDNSKKKSVDGIVYFVNDKGEKLFYLPGDDSYNIDIKATEDGNVNYSLSEYNFIYNENTRLDNYYDIPISVGDELEAVVPAITKEELTEDNTQGSTVDYKLLSDDGLIPADEKFVGKEISEENYEVTLKTEGNGGYVNGAGTFTKGSFAQVEATTLTNSEFYGWYKNGKLMSKESVYRFAVQENVTLTAKFKSLEMRQLKVKSTKGGTVGDVNGMYSKGMEIALVAKANKGYVFGGWSISGGGKIVNANASKTSLIMAKSNATVTAKFVKKDSLAKISYKKLSLKAGKRKTLTIKNGKVKNWKSSNAKVVTVKNGKITTLKKGNAIITATLTSGRKLTCKVKVTSSPTIKIGKKKFNKKTTYSVKRGKKLTVTIAGKAPTMRNVYKTSNKKIAKITSKSTAQKVVIKAYKKKGKVTLTLKVNGVSFKIKVNVK